MPPIKRIDRQQNPQSAVPEAVQTPAGIAGAPFEAAAGSFGQVRNVASVIAQAQENERRKTVAIERQKALNDYRSFLDDERRTAFNTEGFDVYGQGPPTATGERPDITSTFGRKTREYIDKFKPNTRMSEFELEALKTDMETTAVGYIDQVATHQQNQLEKAALAQLDVTTQNLARGAADQAEVVPGFFPDNYISQAASDIQNQIDAGLLGNDEGETALLAAEQAIVKSSLDRMLENNPETVQLLMERDSEPGEKWQEVLDPKEIDTYRSNAKKLIKAQEEADKKAAEEAEKELRFQQDRSISLDILNGDLVTAERKLLTSDLSGEKLRTLSAAIEKAKKGEDEKSDPEVYSRISKRVYVGPKITPAEVYDTPGLSTKDREHFANELQSREGKKDKESIAITRGRMLSQLDRDRSAKIFSDDDDENIDQWTRAVAGFNEYVNSIENNPDAKPNDLIDFYNEMVRPYVTERWWWKDKKERNVEQRLDDMRQHGWFGQRRPDANIPQGYFDTGKTSGGKRVYENPSLPDNDPQKYFVE